MYKEFSSVLLNLFGDLLNLISPFKRPIILSEYFFANSILCKLHKTVMF